jgi:hypothetical protein
MNMSRYRAELSCVQTQEPALVRNVLSACQGISSDTVTCSSDAGGDIIFSVTNSLSPPQQQLIARLCEFGWLFRCFMSGAPCPAAEL